MSRACPSKAGCEQHIGAWQGGFQPVSRFTNILLEEKKCNHVTSGLKNTSCLCYGKIPSRLQEVQGAVGFDIFVCVHFFFLIIFMGFFI